MGDSNIHIKDKEPRHVEIKMHKHRRFAPEQPPAPNGVGSRSGIQQQSSQFFCLEKQRGRNLRHKKKTPAQKKSGKRRVALALLLLLSLSPSLSPVSLEISFPPPPPLFLIPTAPPPRPPLPPSSSSSLRSLPRGGMGGGRHKK